MSDTSVSIAGASPGGDNRPVRYIIEGDAGGEVVVYRASGIGGCERAMVASARAYPPRDTPEKFEAIFAEGHIAEPQILAMYEEQFGMAVTARQQVVLFEVGEINDRRVVVRGAIDGLVLADGTVTLIDAKKFRASTWPKFLAQGIECQPNYPWQFAAYQWALKEMLPGFDVPAYIVGGRWEPAADGDVAAGRIVEIERKLIELPPIPKAAMRVKIARVERLIADGFDPPEVPCASSYPCPWWYLHDDAETKPARKVEDATLRDLAAKWAREKLAEAEAARIASAFKKPLDKTREAIQARMRELGLAVNEAIDVGGLVVDWSETPTKPIPAGVRNNFKVKEVKA